MRLGQWLEPHLSDRERLLRSVKVDDKTGCWNWQKGKDREGYGFAFDRETKSHVRAHRMSWEDFKGQIPDGFHIDHLCRNPSCINPEHLEPVTPRENILRGVGLGAKNARKTHCFRGHEFAVDGFVSTKGERRCRKCATISMREWRAKRALQS